MRDKKTMYIKYQILKVNNLYGFDVQCSLFICNINRVMKLFKTKKYYYLLGKC